MKELEPGIVVHTYNSRTLEAEAGGLQLQGQAGLYSETLHKKMNGRVDTITTFTELKRIIKDYYKQLHS
jgi:hypothetical protein